MHRLDDSNREKRDNRAFLRPSFLLPVAALAVVSLAATLFLVFSEEWTRLALLKGLLFWVVALSLYFLYSRARPAYLRWRKLRENAKKYGKPEGEKK